MASVSRLVGVVKKQNGGRQPALWAREETKWPPFATLFSFNENTKWRYSLYNQENKMAAACSLLWVRKKKLQSSV